MRFARLLLFVGSIFSVVAGCGGGGGGGGGGGNSTDTTPPAVSITSPSHGSTVSGSLTITASVADDRGIAEVSLSLDGAQAGNTFTENPAHVFTTSVSTTALANGSHILKVCAIDTSANSSCSSNVSVTVANSVADTTRPTVFITNPANNAIVSGTFALTASVVDDRGVAEVSLVVDGSQAGNIFAENPANVFTTSFNTSALANGSHTLRACAIDTSENTSCSSEVTVVVFNPVVCYPPFISNRDQTACVCPSGTHQNGNTCVADTTPDTTPPTVYVTAPANNATVSGSLSVTASAVDDRGIGEVSLVVDGSQTGNIFVENPATVFTTSLNTSALANGSHTIKACAVDTSNNTGCSATITVTSLNTPTYSISGVISGDAVANIKVSILVNNAPKTVYTDSRGYYAFSELSEGVYNVFPSQHGYYFTPYSTNVTISNSNVTNVNFSSRIGFGKLTFTNATYVSNIYELYISQSTQNWGADQLRNVYVAPGESYTVTQIPVGMWHVKTVMEFGRDDYSGLISIYPDGTSTWILDDSGTTTNTHIQVGGVTNDNVSIHYDSGAVLYSTTATTGATGQCEIVSPRVAFRLTPSKSGYLFDPSHEYVANPFSSQSLHFSSYLPTFTINGLVQNNSGVMPGVSINLAGPVNLTTTTTSDGTYSFEGLPNGTYTLSAYKTGAHFTPSTQTVTINNSNANVNFWVRSSTVSGKIVGSRISGIVIKIEPESRLSAVTTDASGAFSFFGVEDGSYTITPSLDGYSFSPQSRSITVFGENVLDQDFTSKSDWVSFEGVTTNRLTAIWASSSTSVWAVGNGGTVAHWNGVSWTTTTLEPIDSLTDIWGTSPTDVWVTGYNGHVWRWDGNSWSHAIYEPTLNARAVWGTSPTDIWIAGLWRDLRHWDGSALSAPIGITGHLINDIWGANSNDVWSADENGNIFYWTGSNWYVTTTGVVGISLNGLWGSSPTDVWSVGNSGTVVTSNNKFEWARVTTNDIHDLYGISGSATNDVWICGGGGTVLHWDGSSIHKETTLTPYNLNDISVTGTGEVWAVGDNGTIIHRSP